MTFKGVKTTLVSTLFLAVCSTISVSYAQPSHNKVKPAELITTNEAAEEITIPENFYVNWNSAHVMINRMEYSSLPENLPINLKEGNSEFVFPVKGQLLGQFCYRGRVPHTGVDIALRRGTPVYSSFDGVVRMAKSYGGYGKIVVVRHLNGLETVYSHLSKIKVKVNQKVKAGDIVGLGGRTGKATANHLHFETRYNGAAFDPMLMMDFNTYNLKSDTLVLHRVDFLPKFKIIRSRKRGKSAVAINYDENGRQIVKPIEQPKTAEEATVNTSDSLDAKLSTSKVAPKTVKSNPNSKNAKYVVIRKGDTLGHIAQRNGTTVKRITQLNGITAKKMLQPGKRIRVR